MQARQAVVALGIGAVLVGVAVAGAGTAASARDHASQAWNVLPPGQAGGAAFTKNSTDQIRLYEGLTRLRDRVTDADLPRFFKREILGLGPLKAVKVERPRRGVAERIEFAPGILTQTMRGSNKPTFQQAIAFATRR